MKRHSHIIIYITVLLIFQSLFPAVLLSQTLNVRVPKSIPVGETFRLEYSINSTNISGDVKIGEMPDGIDVVYGPSVSKQQSVSIVNGHTNSSSSTTFTFMLKGNKNGTYKIPPAQIVVGGKTIISKPTQVTISGTSQQKGSGTKFYDENPVKSDPVSHKGNELFIKVSANKHHVTEQEPVVLTYKVYTLLDVTRLDGKMPELKGCHSQEIPIPQKPVHKEQINGKTYNCITWSQYIVYPQVAGDIEIPSISFKALVRKPVGNVDLLEAFLNGGSDYYETEKTVNSPVVNIKVDALKNKPNNFSGGVGKFNIASRVDKNQTSTNEPIRLIVDISGSGNLKLIKEPVVEFPAEVEHYDAKVNDKTRLTSNGVEGTMTYEYIVMPQSSGKITIPAISYCYYNTAEHQYKTISTKPIAIDVKESKKSKTNISDDENSMDTTSGRNGLISSFNIVLSILLTLLVLAGIILFASYYYKMRKSNVDTVAKRAQKANRIAAKRLVKARSFMQHGDKKKFYDEVLNALIGYISDKMNMTKSEMTKEEILKRLNEKYTDTKAIADFMDAIDDCERWKYSSLTEQSEMQSTYDKAMNAIANIETI